MLEVKKENDKITVAFPASLGTAVSKDIEPELKEIAKSAEEKLTFDFNGVTFICSYFLRMFLTAYKEVGGDNFEVINVGPEIKKVLKIAGFDKYLNI